MIQSIQSVRRFRSQAGQGMTEYIIIVALIAIAAIGVYSFFGQAIRGQTSAMTAELAGKSASAGQAVASGAATGASGTTGAKTLGTYGNEQGSR